MRVLLFSLIILVNALSAMESSSEDFMPVHINNLKKTLSLAGSADTAIILEAIKDYLEDDSLEFKDLWYDNDGNQRHFALDVLDIQHHDFIVTFAKTHPEMLFVASWNGKKYDTVDDILVAKWSRSKSRSDEKRRWQLLVNNLRDIHKANKHIKVIKSPLASSSYQKPKVQAKTSSVIPAKKLIFSEDSRRPLELFLKLIKNEKENIFMVFSDFESLRVAYALKAAHERKVDIELIVNPIDARNHLPLKELAKAGLTVGNYQFKKMGRPSATNFALFKSQNAYVHGSWHPEDESEKSLLSLMDIEYDDKEGFTALKKSYRFYFDHSDPQPSGGFFSF